MSLMSMVLAFAPALAARVKSERARKFEAKVERRKLEAEIDRQRDDNLALRREIERLEWRISDLRMAQYRPYQNQQQLSVQAQMQHLMAQQNAYSSHLTPQHMQDDWERLRNCSPGRQSLLSP